ncbi:pseudouridine synthase [Botryobacter ruber]|uniref:pseudouridine synthase n=1 Tax=Botryobacter ruber TaxID=2171629 RepID=UPI000E0A16CE|nr:pseudouridine synthase [Botryobacter ruber]
MAKYNESPDRDNDGAGNRGSERRASGRPATDRGEKKIFNRRDKADRPAREGGERRSFGADRREGGERKPFNSDRRDDRREGGRRDERKSYDRNEGGERRAYGNDRREGGERRSFNSDRPNRNDRGERRSFGGERREGGERRSYGNREGGERRAYGNDRREGAERKSYGADRREGGERRSYGNDRREERESRGNGERRSYSPGAPGNRYGSDNDRRYGGERKPYSDRRSFGREDREENDRPAYRKDRRDDDRASRYSKPAGEGEEGKKPFAGDRKPFDAERNPRLGRGPADRRGRGRDADAEAPTYNLSRYKDNPRIKKEVREKEDDGTIRLNRYIANAGICSRREADSLIEAGEIKVNGEVITEMGYKVKPTDTIQYGKKVLNREKMVYVMLNKPKDFITTTEDPEGRKTVMDLVATASKERIFPVGRLDRNTTGLLLFTNDGELAHKLTHPSNDIKKIYQVELDKPITKDHFRQITEGLELEDGKAMVDDLALIGDTNRFLGIEIHIGRNRIVRRIFEHLGYDVVSLDRVQYAGLTKKDLPRGNWRYLTEKEVIRLKYFM